jgi:hypothetical protein
VLVCSTVERYVIEYKHDFVLFEVTLVYRHFSTVAVMFVLVCALSLLSGVLYAARSGLIGPAIIACQSLFVQISASTVNR